MRFKRVKEFAAFSVPRALVQVASCRTVLVSGKTDEYYAVLDKAARRLASAHLASALSLFSGSYWVRLNNTDSVANLQAGAMLELKPGTVDVDVGTDEYYAVLDATTRQLDWCSAAQRCGIFGERDSERHLLASSLFWAHWRAHYLSFLAAEQLRSYQILTKCLSVLADAF